MTLTLVDWIIVLILAAAVIGGIVRGFFRSAFSLGGLLLGLMLAAWNYWRFAEVLKPLVHSIEVANAIAFLVIALLVMVAAAVIGSLLAGIFRKVGLGCLDRLAGGVFGIVEGMLFVMVCILVTVAFFPKAGWLAEARLPKYFFGALHVSTHVTPERLAERVREELKTLESESPSWMHAEERK
jgi:membrane protein required for colicin V production